MPSQLVNLGLDLRGGAHLLAEVRVEDVHLTRLESLWPDVRDLLRAERARIGTIRLQSSDTAELRVRISNPDEIAHAVTVVRTLAEPVSSLTAAGASNLDVVADGSDIVITLSDAEVAATNDRTVQQALEIIRRRIHEVGTR